MTSDWPQTPGRINTYASTLLSVRVTILDLCPDLPETWSFVTRVAFDIPVTHLHLFSGTKILSSDEHERLYLWDIEKPKVALQLRNVEAGEVSNWRSLIYEEHHLTPDNISEPIGPRSCTANRLLRYHCPDEDDRTLCPSEGLAHRVHCYRSR